MVPDSVISPPDTEPAPRRLKCFDETHQDMIAAAVRLISQKGVASLSIAAVARALQINRTTVYYHFENRDALIKAVREWSAAQLARAFRLDLPTDERIEYLTRFVLENPELIKLWIEEFVSSGDIRNSYPHWQALVDTVSTNMKTDENGEPVDAQILCVILITSTIIAPRVFRNRVAPGENTDTVVRRFRSEQQRWLKRLGMLRAPR
jgi:AcrR family transcriptional regulator